MTRAELDNAALADLLSDARAADEQAEAGPFYPDRGITEASLRAYAEKCRQQATRYSAGGAHDAVLKGAARSTPPSP